MRARLSLALVAGASLFALLPGTAAAQGLFEILRSGGAAYAPADAARRPADVPMSILPSAYRAPAEAAQPKRSASPKTEAPKADAPVEDEDAEVVVEWEQPKAVKIAMPPLRPGASQRFVAELAPIGRGRFSQGGEQLPPGVSLPGASQTPPAAPRLASLPQTQGTPRWTMTDENLVRPASLRDSEQPVEGMPGVFSPPEAVHSCLPLGLKQVLVDAAKHFGHVAVLNARRPQGTGARGSFHYRCRAVDFRVRGAPVSSVMAFLRAHPNVGGRKIYPMGFFHVDDGPVRSW
ncbi:MAG: hypothetical protein ACRC7G_07885 [Beijerinckiaceae bacterium]